MKVGRIAENANNHHSDELVDAISGDIMTKLEQIRSEWSGLIDSERSAVTALTMEAILESQSDSRGGSLPFKALGSDGNVYWIKMVDNRQSARVPVTEQVIAGAGRMIDAPLCKTKLIAIPSDFDGDVLDNGTVLRAGTAHGSLELPNCLFEKWYEPQHRLRDDNRRRHAGYFALYDWCWGDDMQWLYDLTDDWKTYSHDHGHFLPGSPTWTIESMLESVAVPHPVGTSGGNLDDNELERIAVTLERDLRSDLIAVLSSIPSEWPVSRQELEAIGWFLEYRSVSVAARLRQLVG
ncbi:hypothetical protein [Rosistilla oblonga]|uniref:hypothetical protein n=1 Tax=Rosistilla oblonga TaxID=2527990 RepID=UPI003A982170